jgi:polyisoprenoid-binding protein YceI
LTRIDHTHGDLTLHTGKAGAASKVGHDLTIRVGSWEATSEATASAVTAVRLVAQLSSLEVLRGEGGVKPLSDKDKVALLGSARDTLKAEAHPEVVFTSPGFSLTPGETTIQGDLTIAGVTRPITLEALVNQEADGFRFQVRGEVVQTDFNIKPYSGLLGALKVRDMVEVKADLTVHHS